MTEDLAPLSDRLLSEARQSGLSIDMVELDYCLSFVLAAVFSNEELRECLVFKGGTALRKAYFRDYRFSVDLDFTASGGPRGQELEQEIRLVARTVEESLKEQGAFTMTVGRRSESGHHPGGQEAFKFHIRVGLRRALDLLLVAR